jgi:hypothetical protein
MYHDEKRKRGPFLRDFHCMNSHRHDASVEIQATPIFNRVAVYPHAGSALEFIAMPARRPSRAAHASAWASHLFEFIVNPPFVADAERPLRHVS